MNPPKPYDFIESLPSDKTPPSMSEIAIVNSLFTGNSNTKIISELKDSVILMALFILLSLEPINDLLYKVLPTLRNSIYLTLITKAILFSVLYFVIKNFSLIKK